MTAFQVWLLLVRDTLKSTPDKYTIYDLNSHKNLLDQSKKITDDQESDRYWLVLWYVYAKIHMILVDLADFTSAEQYSRECLNFLSKQFPSFGLIVGDRDENKDSADPKIRAPFANVLIAFYNQLGYHENNESSIRYLKEAETLYYEWDKQNPQPPVIEFSDLLKLDTQIKTLQQIVENVECRLDKDKQQMLIAHVGTLEILAQIYQTLNKPSESAYYCKQTLRFQYPLLKQKSYKVDHIDWALNMATLSQHFAEQGQFNMARHMIACARNVLNETDLKIKENENESFRKAHADLNIIEVKYCLMILDENFESRDQFKNYSELDSQFEPLFPNHEHVQQLEAKLPQFPARDYEQAKKVFHYALESIKAAKSFFTINERCSDYINCTFDHSRIYGSMMPFVTEIDSRCKMNKRRIDLLEHILKELNPQYFLKYIRKLLYELGDLYSQQVSLKMHQYESNYDKNRKEIQLNVESSCNKKQTPQQNESKIKSDMEKNLHAMKKVNLLTNKSIVHLYKFLSSFDYLNKDKLLKNLPELQVSVDKIQMYPLPDIIQEEEYIQPILTAYLIIGRMYTKFVTNEPEQRRRNWFICENYYLELKSYVDRNVEHREKYFPNYGQLLEMLELIPIKTRNI